MLERGPIVVPLDGSELAEQVLPYAGALAGKLGAPLVLTTLWEGEDADLAATFPSMAVDMASAAQEHYEKYHADLKSRTGLQDAQSIVRGGRAVDGILDVSEEVGARAIAIATHGRSGIGRWVYGSTASSLLRSSPVPLLVVGPNVLNKKRAAVDFKRIMAPLDGSDASELALPVAANLAQALGAKLELARSLQWAAQAYPYTLPDSYVPQLDDELEGGAKEYLRRQKQSLADGVDAEAFVVRGSPADALLDLVDQHSIDLVVMTTHARKGLARAALGSVADRMLQGAAPVVLIRVEEK